MSKLKLYSEYHSYGKDNLIAWLEFFQTLFNAIFERMKEKRLHKLCRGVYGNSTLKIVNNIARGYHVYCALRGEELDAECDKFGVERKPKEKDYELAQRLMAKIHGFGQYEG